MADELRQVNIVVKASGKDESADRKYLGDLMKYVRTYLKDESLIAVRDVLEQTDRKDSSLTAARGKEGKAAPLWGLVSQETSDQIGNVFDVLRTIRKVGEMSQSAMNGDWFKLAGQVATLDEKTEGMIRQTPDLFNSLMQGAFSPLRNQKNLPSAGMPGSPDIAPGSPLDLFRNMFPKVPGLSNLFDDMVPKVPGLSNLFDDMIPEMPGLSNLLDDLIPEMPGLSNLLDDLIPEMPEIPGLSGFLEALTGIKDSLLSLIPGLSRLISLLERIINIYNRLEKIFIAIRDGDIFSLLKALGFGDETVDWLESIYRRTMAIIELYDKGNYAGILSILGLDELYEKVKEFFRSYFDQFVRFLENTLVGSISRILKRLETTIAGSIVNICKTVITDCWEFLEKKLQPIAKYLWIIAGIIALIAIQSGLLPLAFQLAFAAIVAYAVFHFDSIVATIWGKMNWLGQEIVRLGMEYFPDTTTFLLESFDFALNEIKGWWNDLMNLFSSEKGFDFSKLKEKLKGLIPESVQNFFSNISGWISGGGSEKNGKASQSSWSFGSLLGLSGNESVKEGSRWSDYLSAFNFNKSGGSSNSGAVEKGVASFAPAVGGNVRSGGSKVINLSISFGDIITTGSGAGAAIRSSIMASLNDLADDIAAELGLPDAEVLS